jgi:hypothetical protein
MVYSLLENGGLKMSNITRNFIIICVLLIGLTITANATQYTIDNAGNTVMKVNLSGSTHTFIVNPTGGSPVSSNAIYPFSDDFNGGSLNGSWASSQQGTSSGTISVSGGKLTLAGQSNVASSSNAVLTAVLH